MFVCCLLVGPFAVLFRFLFLFFSRILKLVLYDSSSIHQGNPNSQNKNQFGIPNEAIEFVLEILRQRQRQPSLIAVPASSLLAAKITFP